MDLQIRYYHGSMVIHLENFLSMHSISRVRNLLKIIRTSYTPECEKQIRNFIEQENEQFEPKQMENQRYIMGYTEKVNFCQKQVENATYNRNKYKRKSDGWEHYNSYVKQFREEMKDLKAMLRSRQADYNRNIRDNEFYKKVLEILL